MFGLSEEEAAHRALLAWLKSQDLSPEQSIPVLLMGIASAILGIARANRRPAVEGAEFIGRLLVQVVEEVAHAGIGGDAAD